MSTPERTAIRATMRHTASGQILAWDDGMERLSGWASEDVVGTSGLDMVHPADRRIAIDAWREMMENGRARPRVWRRLNKDGTYGRMEVVVEGHLEDPDGSHVLLHVTDASDTGPSVAADATLTEEPTRPARRGTILETVAGEIIDWDRNMEHMTGRTLDEVRDVPAIDGVHPDDRSLAVDAWMEMLDQGRSTTRRWRVRHADGTYFWCDNTIESLLDEPGGYVKVEVVDVSEEMATRQALDAQELRLNHIARVVPTGLFQVERDLRIVYANDRLHQMLGTAPAERLADQVASVVPDDRAEILDAVARALAGAEGEDVTVDVRLPGTGEPRRCLFSIRAIEDRLGGVMSVIACVTDVTETARRLVELERDLIQRTFHDPLTGLGNRSLLLNRIDEAITHTRHTGDAAALLLVDLDEFKAVNDALGHTVGDDLLRTFADRLRSLVRPGDVVARVDGDEFAVLMEQYIDPDHPRRTAEQILSACAQPVEVDGHLLRMDVSAGIATTTNGPGREELLRDADLALHRAKTTGRRHYEIFEPEMHEAALARVELERSLSRAVDDEQLLVVYQPIHDLTTGAVVSVEALVRWRHPERGLVAPADFIPLAEETGLIVPIGRWVLEQACTRAARWDGPIPTGDGPRVSVNVSARQLASPSLVDDVGSALRDSGLTPERLVLEITESVLMERTTTGMAPLEGLKELGVALAIDDFGTGYSSLAYLQRLPVDILKIDKAFVDGVAQGGRHAKLIGGILTLSHDLGLAAVAEGIETDDQLRSLQALNCPAGQGYLFSRPLEAAALGTYLNPGAPAATTTLVTSVDLSSRLAGR